MDKLMAPLLCCLPCKRLLSSCYSQESILEVSPSLPLPSNELAEQVIRVGWPQHCILLGHHGPVTSLLYPSAHSKAYDRDYVLSGATDFTVKLWDLFSGVLVHTFAVHGGKVKDIVSCPPDINVGGDL